MSILNSLQKVRYACPYFQKCPGNFTFSLFLTECPVPGSMFRRRLSFCGRKIIREYFTGKSGAFHGFFSYFGESRIIKTPINWKDKVDKSDEWICTDKSKNTLYKKIEKKILEIHPYEVPEIIAVPIVNGSNEYLKWVDEETE